MEIKMPTLQAEIPMRQASKMQTGSCCGPAWNPTETCLQLHGSCSWEPSPFLLLHQPFLLCCSPPVSLLSSSLLPLHAWFQVMISQVPRDPSPTPSPYLRTVLQFSPLDGDPLQERKGAAVAKGWLVEWISGQVDGRSNLPQLHLWQKLTSFIQIGDIPAHFMVCGLSAFPQATEKAMAPHSSTLAWKIPWMEEPGGLRSMGSQRVRHDWATSLSLFTFMHWRRKWQPTAVFLPGESQGRGSLVGCRLWGRTELDTTEAT